MVKASKKGIVAKIGDNVFFVSKHVVSIVSSDKNIAVYMGGKLAFNCSCVSHTLNGKKYDSNKDMANKMIAAMHPMF